MDWDVFISHAREDKESFARPLAQALEREGLRVWFDEFTLSVGDKLRRSIDRGLANSRYGVVILSKNFFKKEWPQKELDGLATREISGEKVILPVWHNITAEQVRRYSPTLADLVAVESNRGLEQVVKELLRAMHPHLEEAGVKEREETGREAREKAERVEMQQQRTRILQLIYEERTRGFPYALDSEELAHRMGIQWEEIRPEVTYLEEKGYIVLNRRQIGNRIFYTLRITATGIDLLEGRAD